MKKFTGILIAISLTLMLAFNSNAQEVIKVANVGIGTISPTEKLDVVGNIKFSGALMPNNSSGNAGNLLLSAGANTAPTWLPNGTTGQLLTITAGVPTWSTLSLTSGWALTGNSGTTAGTNYIGTTDDHGLYFEVNGAYAGALDALNNDYTGANVYLGGASTSAPILPGAGNNDAGDNNVAIGLSAMASAGGTSWTGSNSTGTSYISANVAIGAYAFSSAVYGGGNTALGAYSLRLFNYPTTATTTGNTGAGYKSLYSNSTGLYNTAIGYTSMYGSGSATATGNYNTAMGYQSLYNVGAGMASNTAIGSNALYNTTASKNTAIGDSALYTNTTGTFNTAIGYQANVGANNLTNATAIGYQAVAPVSNSIALGNASVNALYLPGYTAVGDILYTGAGTGLVTALTPGTAGTVLVSGGAGAAPTWQSVGGTNTVTGTAPIYSTGGATPVVSIQGTATDQGSILYSKGAGTSAAFLPTSATSGYVLQSNGTSAPSWVSPSAASGWALTGNSGTIPGTNYIGTTTDEGLVFWVNNAYAGSLDPLNTNYSAANVYLGAASTSSPVLSGAGNFDRGDNNVGIGLAAMANAGTGSPAYAGNGSNSTVGYITGSVAVGVYALSSTTYGAGNTALGAYSQRLANYTSEAALSGGFNTSAGAYSLYSNSTGQYNTTIGYKSMYGSGSATAVGNYNAALGYNALYTAGAGITSNTAIGSNSLYNTSSGNRNTAVGDSALASNTTGYYNTALGYDADVNPGTLTNATAIGYQAMATVSNSITLGNVSATSLYLPGYAAVGDILYTSAGTGLVSALTPGTSGYVLVSNGSGAAPSWASVTGVNSVTGTVPIYSTGGATPAVSIQGTTTDQGSILYSKGAGTSAAFLATGTSGYILQSNGTAAPSWVSPSAASGWALTGNSILTGQFLGTTDNQPLMFRLNNVFSGDISGITTGSGESVVLGYGANSIGGSANEGGGGSVVLGYEAEYNNGTANGNSTVVGANALYTTSTGVTAGVVAVGYSSQYYATSNMGLNTSVGSYSLYSNTSGGSETAIGYNSMYGNGTSTGYFGGSNTAVGYQSLYGGAGTQGGLSNTAVGSNALYNNTNTGTVGVGGNRNTAVGDSALVTNTTGYYNTALGYDADVSANNLTNATVIGYKAIAPASNSVTLGNSNVTSLYLPGYTATGDLLYISAATGLVSALTPGITGTVLESSGGGAPMWASVAGANSVTGNAPVYITGTATNPIVNVQGNISGTDAGGVLYSTGAGTAATFTPTPTGAGLVLTSTAAGGAPTWQAGPAASASWLIVGNSGTVPGTNYIGTSSTQALEFKVNAVPSGWIDYTTNDNSYFGYGTGGGITSASAGGDYGTANVAMGVYAMGNIPSGASVTATEAIGAYAMQYATAANANTAFGAYSQYYNNGYQNVSVGAYSLYSNSGTASATLGSAGINETAIGYQSMYGSGTAGSIGTANTAVGYRSLYSITTGGSNTAVGSNALYNSTGGRNTAVGDSALASNTTGEFNTAVGYQAMATTTITTGGNYNTALGYNANISSGTLTYATAIGANAYAAQSNSMVLGAISGVNGASANTNVCIGTNAPATDAGLSIKTLHIETQQTAVPTVTATGTNVGSQSALGTDVGGNITFSVTGAGSSGSQVQVNFATAYINAPAVIITAANAATGAIMSTLQPYVNSTSTGNFTIGFTNAPSAGGPYTFNYFVIETQ